MKPIGKVKIKWSHKFAYAIGLLTTDGTLSKDGRHISFTSKDEELVLLFKNCLGINNVIGKKASGTTKEKKYFVVQFGDILFYRFLLKIGLMPNKSRQLKSLRIPKKYFFSFLRGHFDGDGTIYSYYDKRWQSSFMFYVSFCSASSAHILWLRAYIFNMIGIKGHLNRSEKNNLHGKSLLFQLKFAKKESVKLLQKLYPSDEKFYLSRKYSKINKIFAQVEESVDSLL